MRSELSALAKKYIVSEIALSSATSSNNLFVFRVLQNVYVGIDLYSCIYKI
jgi:hypothetical protein